MTTTKQQLEAELATQIAKELFHLGECARLRKEIAELPNVKKWIDEFPMYPSKICFQSEKDRDLHDEWFLMTARAMTEKYTPDELVFAVVSISGKVVSGAKQYLERYYTWFVVFKTRPEAERYAELCKLVAEMATRHLV